MQIVFVGPRLVALLIAAIALVGSAQAQSTSSPEPESTPEAAASEYSSESVLPPEDELYTLPDLPETDKAPMTGIDIGKLGKKGSLSLERMPLDRDNPLDDRRKGAAGVRLKVPLGKQGQ